jgi:DNA end-binding protein Ku
MPMPEDQDEQGASASRAMWSGTITFGLVSVPVSLFAGARSGGAPLHMITPNGTPLKRRYFSPTSNREVHPEHIIRGYEIEEDEYVPVTEEELERLAPEKSRDIDLKLFVDVDDIDPIFFERPYFMLPDRDSDKAYRLLVDAMESSGKAGIARFVMRDKEYLVTIIAEDGLLRAETMRFHDEIRSSADVGLDDHPKVSKAKVTKMANAIKSLSAPNLKGADLHEHRTERLLKLVESKLKKGEDVIEGEVAEQESSDEMSMKDLMQSIAKSVESAKRSSKRTGARHGRDDKGRGEHRRASSGTHGRGKQRGRRRASRKRTGTARRR